MPLKEIPPEHWVIFFDNFRRMHLNAPVIVEVLSDSVLQTVVRNLPLQDITADLRDDRHHMVSISAGQEAGQYMTHMVPSPTRVQLQTTEDGDDQALRIESSGGKTTLLRFHTMVKNEAEQELERVGQKGATTIL